MEGLNILCMHTICKNNRVFIFVFETFFFVQPRVMNNLFASSGWGDLTLNKKSKMMPVSLPISRLIHPKIGISRIPKFMLFFLLPYVLLGCSRDGPPYPVELSITIEEVDRNTRVGKIVLVGIYRRGAVPPFDSPALFTHVRTNEFGKVDVSLQLPQPTNLYFLQVDSMPFDYARDLQGWYLTEEKKQTVTLSIYPP